MVRPKVNKLLTAVGVLSLIAMGITGYLTYLKFAPTDSSFCVLGGDCDIVNASQWSYFPFTEIPVSILGLGTYLLFFVFSIVLIKKMVNWRKIHSKLNELLVLNALRYLSIIGVLFSLWLTYVEAFILQAWCEYCVTQQIIIILIMLLFFKINSVIKADTKEKKVCEFC